MLSLFVMDVSNSTKYNNADEIKGLLIQLTHDIATWTKTLDFKYINFRMGDELFFVTNNLTATLLISYYIKLLWPLKRQPIKFGIAASNCELPKGNLEHWNAPIIKQARYNLEQIKHSDISDMYLTIDNEDTSFLNDILYPYLTEIIQSHSMMQRNTILLSHVFEQQKDIAQYLNKSMSTISEHLKKGHKKQLLLIEAALQKVDATSEFKPDLQTTFKEFII